MRMHARGSRVLTVLSRTTGHSAARLAVVSLAAIIGCAGALPASAAGSSGPAGAAGPPRPDPAPTPAPGSNLVLAWGDNAFGELGTGTTKRHLNPAWVKLPAHVRVTSIASGALSDFAVTSTGRVLAWGINTYGLLGDGTTTPRKAPVYVKLPSGTKARSVAAGLQHTLVLTTGHRLLAWGLNDSGQLGNGTTTDSLKPVKVKMPSSLEVTAVVAGKYFSMALTSSHQVLA